MATVIFQLAKRSGREHPLLILAGFSSSSIMRPWGGGGPAGLLLLHRSTPPCVERCKPRSRTLELCGSHHRRTYCATPPGGGLPNFTASFYSLNVAVSLRSACARRMRSAAIFACKDRIFPLNPSILSLRIKEVWKRLVQFKRTVKRVHGAISSGGGGGEGGVSGLERESPRGKSANRGESQP
jgi:hypothetical protein